MVLVTTRGESYKITELLKTLLRG